MGNDGDTQARANAAAVRIVRPGEGDGGHGDGRQYEDIYKDSASGASTPLCRWARRGVSREWTTSGPPDAAGPEGAAV